MQLMLIAMLSALGAVGGLAQEWQVPQTQTMPRGGELALPTAVHGDNLGYSYGGAPEPTTAPDVFIVDLMRRQQDISTTVCGVLATNTSWSYTCNDAWVCGYNTQDRNNFGCCSSYIGSAVTGCYFPTACYDYTKAQTMAACSVKTGACVWSSLYCTNSLRPFCGEYVNAYGLTALDCFRSASWTYTLADPNAAVVTTTTPRSSGSSGGSVSLTTPLLTSSSALSTATSDSVPAGQTVPFTQSQRVASSTPPSVLQTSSKGEAGFVVLPGRESGGRVGWILSLLLLVL